MSKYLLIDIGAGTMDMLYYDDQSDHQYKAVVKSPVRLLAEEIENISGNLLLIGREMGGGPVSSILQKRAGEAEVLMTASAAATINHNLDRVRTMGIRIVNNREAGDLLRDLKYSSVTLGDLQIERIKEIVSGFGVPFSFDVVGICAQDHGVPPDGISHLDYRHKLFQDHLNDNPFPHTVLYASKDVPPTFNRLSSIAQDAQAFGAKVTFVMDSGMAAILGASTDERAKEKECILVLDIATSHTVAAILRNDEIMGFFEYHTSDITLERLEFLIKALADGKLSHEQILNEGGHGAYIRKSVGFSSIDIFLATGPKRNLLKGSSLPIKWGAPLGDNMMTGTAGLLTAIRVRKGPAF